MSPRRYRKPSAFLSLSGHLNNNRWNLPRKDWQPQFPLSLEQNSIDSSVSLIGGDLAIAPRKMHNEFLSYEFEV